MPHQQDVSLTLGDLERKLRDLERELAGAAEPATTATPAPVRPPAPVAKRPPAPEPLVTAPAPPLSDPEAQRLIAEAKASLGGMHHQLDDLVRVREELERSTRELMAEYGRVLSTFGVAAEPGGAPADAIASTPAPTAVAALTPIGPPASPWADVAAAASAPVQWTPVAAVAPSAATPAAGPAAADSTVFSGQVTVDAGPFTDIGTLSAFEQALGQVPGTQDVYVRGFEGSRALIDIVLGGSVALGAELRRTAPVGFSLVATGPNHVSITIDGGRHA